MNDNEPEELICGESYDHPDLMVLQDDEDGFYAVCRQCDAEVHG